MPPKEKSCRNPQCENTFLQFNSLKPYCSYACEKAHKGKPKAIKKFSATRLKEIPIYNKLREAFLARPENQVCFIDGCYNVADTIEHTMGREGYADDWARDNKITLYIDERFFAGCCWEHNGELERNPKLSKQYQLSKIHGGKKL